MTLHSLKTYFKLIHNDSTNSQNHALIPFISNNASFTNFSRINRYDATLITNDNDQISKLDTKREHLVEHRY